jgi:hypothetical protein
MQAGMLLLGIAGSVIAVLPYRATSTTKYRVDGRLSQEADATALGGGKQLFAMKTATYVTLTLSDSAGGRAIKMVVDSIRGDSLPPGVTAEDLNKAKGSVVTGFSDPKGNVTNVKSSAESVAGLGLTGLVSQLVLPARSGLKVGDTWSDTTETSNPVGGGSLGSRTVTNWKVNGSETRAGVKAMKIDGAFASAIAGAQETPGGAVDIEGTATGTNSVFIGPDGRHLGGTTTSKSNLNATLAAQGVTLPIVIDASSTITVLP